HVIKRLSADDLELSSDGKLLVAIGRVDHDGSGDGLKITLFGTSPWSEKASRFIGDNVEKLSMAVDENHIHLCTRHDLRQYSVSGGSLTEKVVHQFTPAATNCRFFGERSVSSHADGVVRVWDDSGTLVAQASANVDSASSADGAFAMAFGTKTLAA